MQSFIKLFCYKESTSAYFFVSYLHVSFYQMCVIFHEQSSEPTSQSQTQERDDDDDDSDDDDVQVTIGDIKAFPVTR